MQPAQKCFLATAAACLSGIVLAAPSLAQSGASACPGFYLYHGYYYTTQGNYGSYQGPDGTYDSLSDFVSAIRGRPCDMECTRRAQERWLRYYREQAYQCGHSRQHDHPHKLM